MVSKIRRFFQYISTVAIDNYVKGVLIGQAIYQGVFKNVPVPALNCYSCPLSRFACPIGTFQHFLTVRQVPYFMLGFFGFIGGLIGRAPCGWICPFGLFQELLYKIPSFKFRLPEWVKYIKYFVLVILTILLPLILLEPWFCKFCPAGTIEAGIPLLSWNPVKTMGSSLYDLLTTHFYVKYGILILLLSLFITTKRPFCRMFCPLGAIFSLFNKFAFIRMEVDLNKCSRCDLCYNVCPMEVRIWQNPDNVDCIRCMKCYDVCPDKAIKVVTPLTMARELQITHELKVPAPPPS